MTEQQRDIVSIEINREHIFGALVAADGSLAAVRAVPTPLDASGSTVVDLLLTVCKHILVHTEPDAVQGIAVAVAAPVDATSGVVLSGTTLPMLDGVPLAAQLEQAFHLPILIENDVNAMAMAEANTPENATCGSLFYVYADYDISGAIVYEGQLWKGMHSHAGDIAHLVAAWMGPKPITLGQRASGAGIAAEYNMRSRKYRVPSLVDIIQYARQGDQLAARVIRDGAQMLGTVMCPVIGLLDYDCVTVGGMLAYESEPWWDGFRKAFHLSATPRYGDLRLSRAQYGEEAALIGMATLMRHHGAVSAGE